MLYVFDVDGTLEIEKNIIIARRAEQIRCIAEKYSISLDNANLLFLKKQKELAKKATDGGGVFLKSQFPSTVDIICDLGFTREEYFKMIDAVDPVGLVKLQPNTNEVLEELSKNNVLVVYSNSSLLALERTLSYLDIQKYFTRLYTSEYFKESKPSLTILKKIIAEQKMTPKDTFVVGNSYEKDVLPAIAIGAKGVLFDVVGIYETEPIESVVTRIVSLKELI